MADYDNTVDILTDDVFTDALITRNFPSDFDGNLVDDKVIEVGSYALCDVLGIKTAYFPLVTETGISAFEGCKDLQSVDFPTLTEVGSDCFRHCEALTDVNLPEAIRVDSNAFQYCTGLVSISLPKATSLPSYTFGGCTKLAEVDFPLVENVQGSALVDCNSLKIVTLPACTYFVAGLMDCDSLEVVNLPAVTELGVNCFNGSKAIKEINIGPNIAKIDSYAFANMAGGSGTGVVINLPVSEGAIEGAPWGASKATINYDHEYVEGTL